MFHGNSRVIAPFLALRLFGLRFAHLTGMTNSLYKHNLLYKHHLIIVTTTFNQPTGKWVPSVSISPKMNYDSQFQPITDLDKQFDTRSDAVEFGKKASKAWIDDRCQTANGSCQNPEICEPPSE
jgi:hypothetical protein